MDALGWKQRVVFLVLSVLLMVVLVKWPLHLVALGVLSLVAVAALVFDWENDRLRVNPNGLQVEQVQGLTPGAFVFWQQDSSKPPVLARVVEIRERDGSLYVDLERTAEG